MTAKKREFIDRDRDIAFAFYDLETYSGRNGPSLERKLRQLMKEDPDFLDSYILLYEILKDNGRYSRADGVLDEAYERALKLITDKNGNWPGILEWMHLENRHVIRAILNKAISLWGHGETDDALDLFRKLLRTNPRDNVGARQYILAIRMGMGYEGFEARFNKDGYYDNELMDWIRNNIDKFPDEFGWWQKRIHGE